MLKGRLIAAKTLVGEEAF